MLTPCNLPLTQGAIAGTVNVFMTMPLDMVKTRMQSASASKNYKNSIHCLYTVATKEGVLSLWKGVTPRLCRLSVSVNRTEESLSQSLIINSLAGIWGHNFWSLREDSQDFGCSIILNNLRCKYMNGVTMRIPLCELLVHMVSMWNEKEGSGTLIPTVQRIYLRFSRLQGVDEIPQLIRVVSNSAPRP